ncbi:MAG: beta-xylosidase [Acidobacteria bacterium]|nr:beta-xylosidase [Acidobacteriota bacterium]
MAVMACTPAVCAAQPFQVQIRVDAARARGEMRPIWAWFGYDEPNYTYMRDGRKLLSQLAALSAVPVHVRAHNLMTSGDGTPALKWGSTNMYREDAAGRPRYDWSIIDRIFDTYVERGMKPLVEIGFMPEALTAGPPPYRHSFSLEPLNRSIAGAWAYPPKDYRKWSELVYEWVRHSVERYGKAEVESWWWELWNEPDIGYWKGTQEEFHKLYDYTSEAVKRALPTAKFGGPHIAGSSREETLQWLRVFLEHALRGKNAATGGTGAPLDFVAFHAKGVPEVAGGHVRMGIARHLHTLEALLGVVSSYRELRGRPVIIGESDPEGCAACSARVFPQNAYRNGTVYSSYTAASFARKYELADRTGVNLAGAVTWAFEFEDQPWFDGFRSLATNGIEKPVLNVFRMFGLMGGERVGVESSAAVGLDDIVRAGVRGQPDVSALAARRGRQVSVMVWHYHDDDVAGPDADVALAVRGLPEEARRALATHYRIDRDHSNAYEAWKRMGSPQKPTAEQYAQLERAAALSLLSSPEWVKAQDGGVTLRFILPRQAVSLLQLEW